MRRADLPAAAHPTRSLEVECLARREQSAASAAGGGVYPHLAKPGPREESALTKPRLAVSRGWALERAQLQEWPLPKSPGRGQGQRIARSGCRGDTLAPGDSPPSPRGCRSVWPLTWGRGSCRAGRCRRHQAGRAGQDRTAASASATRPTRASPFCPGRRRPGRSRAGAIWGSRAGRSSGRCSCSRLPARGFSLLCTSRRCSGTRGPRPESGRGYRAQSGRAWGRPGRGEGAQPRAPRRPAVLSPTSASTLLGQLSARTRAAALCRQNPLPALTSCCPDPAAFAWVQGRPRPCTLVGEVLPRMMSTLAIVEIYWVPEADKNFLFCRELSLGNVRYCFLGRDPSLRFPTSWGPSAGPWPVTFPARCSLCPPRARSLLPGLCSRYLVKPSAGAIRAKRRARGGGGGGGNKGRLLAPSALSSPRCLLRCTPSSSLGTFLSWVPDEENLGAGL